MERSAKKDHKCQLANQPHHSIGSLSLSVACTVNLSLHPPAQLSVRHLRGSESCTFVSAYSCIVEPRSYLVDSMTTRLLVAGTKLETANSSGCVSTVMPSTLGGSVWVLALVASALSSFPEPKVEEERPPHVSRPEGRPIGPQQAQISLQGAPKVHVNQLIVRKSLVLFAVGIPLCMAISYLSLTCR